MDTPMDSGTEVTETKRRGGEGGDFEWLWWASARIHAAQMAMVVSDDLVVLEIPALDHLILASGEKVRRTRAATSAHLVSMQITYGLIDEAPTLLVLRPMSSPDRQPTHGRDVAGQSQLENARRQIPYLQRANAFNPKSIRKTLSSPQSPGPGHASTSQSPHHYTGTRQVLTLIVRSAEPVTNHWFVGSTAMQRTQPR